MRVNLFPHWTDPPDPEIAALQNLRDEAHTTMRHAMARLHQLAPAFYPDPSPIVPTNSVNWSNLPIHESEPRE